MLRCARDRMKIIKPEIGSLIVSGPFAGMPYRTAKAVLADPAWKFKSRTALQTRNYESARDVDKHYETMDLAAIKALPVLDLCAPGCHLFICGTGPMLPDAIDTLRAWGFKYSTVVFTWAKLKRGHNTMQLRITPLIEGDFHVGLGLTTRKNCEFVLLGRRGNARREARDVRELIIAPVREHSRKPDELRARIMRYSVGPYVELFGRESSPGWLTWGNQATKFDAG